MYILQNAIKNIGRDRGRNMLMGVIILVIIVATAVSLIINNTAKGLMDDYKNQFGAEVIISPDIDKLIAQGQDAMRLNPITPEMYLSFGESEYLKDVRYTCQISAVSKTIEAVDQNEGGANDGKAIQILESNGIMPMMKVIGNVEFNHIAEFNEEQRKIIDGRAFENKNECIISRELASLNGLKVGGHITIQNAMAEDDEFEFTITGIYQDATDDYGSIPMKIPYMNRRNEILTSVETLLASPGAKANERDIFGVFFLKTPEVLPAFEAELNAKGLPDLYKISTDEAGYNKIIAPVEGLKSIAMIFTVIVLVIGVIILILQSTISMRERKYEIGVLRAMGMKREKIVVGFLSETIMITAICLVLGLGIGVMAVQPVSDILLKNRIEAAQIKKSPAAYGGKTLIANGQNLMAETDAKALTEMKVGLDFNTNWQIVIISLLLAGAANVAGIGYISRCEPIKMLSERN